MPTYTATIRKTQLQDASILEQLTIVSQTGEGEDTVYNVEFPMDKIKALTDAAALDNSFIRLVPKEAGMQMVIFGADDTHASQCVAVPEDTPEVWARVKETGRERGLSDEQLAQLGS